MIVNEKSRNIMPASPPDRAIGRYTTILVRVDAITARPTSLLPFMAASSAFRPCLFRVNIFSSTTTELSTSIPMASVSEPSVSMFSDMSRTFITQNVARIDVGIEIPITSVDLIFLRKKNITMTASIAPCTAVLATELIDCLTKSDWSKPIWILTWSPYLSFISFISF